MTNDQTECLAKIKQSEELVRYFVETYGQMAQSTEEALFAPFRALRTVIEKHLQEYESVSDSVWNRNPICSCGSHAFPCQTITDIKKELGI